MVLWGTVNSHRMRVSVAFDHTVMPGLNSVTATSAEKCKVVSKSTWNIHSLAYCSSPVYLQGFLNFNLKITVPAAS